MKNDFLNRTQYQRTILTMVNNYTWNEEPLLGLTEKAILRWYSKNNQYIKVKDLLIMISAKFLFLANISQESITDEYKYLSLELSSYLELLDAQLKNRV